MSCESCHAVVAIEALHHAVVELRNLVSSHLESPYSDADWARLRTLAGYEVKAGTALSAMKKVEAGKEGVVA